MMRRQAQSINEYVIVIALVTTVFVVMQMYIKRGIQASIKDTADLMGAQAEPYLFEGRLSAQQLGVMEKGLTSYAVTLKPQSLYQKHVTVNTSAGGQIEKVTNDDIVASQAAWASTYNAESDMGFSSYDKLSGNKKNREENK